MPKLKTSPRSEPLSIKQYARAVWNVAKISAKVSPSAMVSKLVGSLIDAVLPIVTTYFAALTTTELASAFAGNSESGERALLYVVITSALGLVTLIWGSIDGYIQQVFRFKIEAKISDMMYEKFHKLDFWRYDDKDTIDLYDRAQRFSQFFAYVINSITNLFASVITVVLSVVALAIFVPWIALLVLVAVLPGAYLQFRLSRLQIKHWNRNVESRRSRSFIEFQLLQPTTIAELRLNNLVRTLLNMRAKYRDKDNREQLAYEKEFIPKRLATDILQAAAELMALIWIALEIINRQQPIGQFVYVQQLVSRSLSSATSFVSQLSNMDEDLANLADYEKFMELSTPEREGAKLPEQPKSIRFENVSFSYPHGDEPVLQDINLEIKAGDHIAIVGENGAGKSTFIKLLAGLYQPTSGRVMLDDIDLATLDPASWHKYLSVLQQDFLQYRFTNAKQNVLFGDADKDVDQELYEKSLRDGEAFDMVQRLPKKDHTILNKWFEDGEGDKGTDLSGGQWQRLALARSFYRDAPFVIFDEPTSAIDALAEARIFRRLFAKNDERTIITISHRLTTVEKADRIVVFEDGRIVEQGTHDVLAASDGTYATLFADQMR